MIRAGVNMEKYCKNCGKVFNDLKFKLCPFCGGKLDTRYGRQPIPRKLRHEVFKRDGYRCRECGASKDETSLEIDHIVPVARGGTNDIDNLQTLCRECNRMKHTDEWVGGETDLEVAKNELRNLEKQLNYAKKRLKNAISDDEKIEYQFDIMKINETIVTVEEKIRKLEIEKLKLREHQKANEAKEKFYKKLYVQLSDDDIGALSNIYRIKGNKDKIIRFLADNCTENEIYAVLTNYKAAQKEKDRREKVQKKMSRWEKSGGGATQKEKVRNETIQDKMDRWKKAGWGATQKEMERWDKARKEKSKVEQARNEKYQRERPRKENARRETAQKEINGLEKARRVMVQNEIDRLEKAKKKKAQREKDRKEKVRRERARKEKDRIKKEKIVVAGEVNCLGGATYRYTYKTSDGEKGSIYGSCIEDLKIKSRQYKIQWNP